MNGGFLIDECLHRRLVNTARDRGHPAEHVVALGLGGAPDPLIAGAAVGRGAVLVTNNRRDFRRIYGRLKRHPGLLVIIPNGALSTQTRLFEAALDHVEANPMTDRLLEISISGEINFQTWRAEDA